MADSTEQKLSMSLDDLVKKERFKHKPQFHQENSAPGPQRRSQQPMGNWPWRGQQQHQQPRANGAGKPAGAGWAQPGPNRQQQQQQQQWAGMAEHQQPQQQGQYPQQRQQQRGSVFSRLGGVADTGNHMLQQPYQQQQMYQQRQQPQQRQQQHGGGYMHQQQQQPPQPQRVVQPPPKPVRPKLQCTEDEDGNASLYHQDYLIIHVSPAGDMVLDSGDDHSAERRAAFNIALSHFNIAIREAPQPPGLAAGSQPGWNVSEGHRLVRFTDGMRIPSRGPLTSNRAAVLLAAYGENSDKAAAELAAAQEASRKAAIAAGLLPESAADDSAAAGEDAEAARIRRLKAQGRYMPY